MYRNSLRRLVIRSFVDKRAAAIFAGHAVCGHRHRSNGGRGSSFWCSLTVNTALRLERYFGTTPEFWINLQTRYDLDVAERTVRRDIEREIEPHAA